MDRTQLDVAVPAAQESLRRHDRAAESPADPVRFSGNAGPANSAGRQTVERLIGPPATTIEPGAHLAAAAYLFKHSRDCALVVTTDGTHEPDAMITDAETAPVVADGRNLEDIRISQGLRQKPLTVDLDIGAADAARLMLSNGVQHLPVVDGRRLVGMVDLADLCRAILEFGPSAAAAGTP